MANKKYFIDCGANDGCSVRKFIQENKDHEEYFIHSFEPNPNLHGYFGDIESKFRERFKLHKVGVSNKDCSLTFYSNPNYSSAGTFNKSKGTKKNCGSSVHCDQVDQLSVQCINLSDWIIKNLSKDDYIILKLDVEGAEYDIVPQMIKDKTFSYINSFLIEWHDKWCDQPKGTSQKYSDRINNEFNLIPTHWDAQPFQILK